VPTLQEQQKIVNKIEVIETNIKALQDDLKKIAKQKKEIMAKYL
jgi:restriction endonuclease S subunit